jgi:hypothetical protein
MLLPPRCVSPTTTQNEKCKKNSGHFSNLKDDIILYRRDYNRWRGKSKGKKRGCETERRRMGRKYEKDDDVNGVIHDVWSTRGAQSRTKISEV